ncbi:MAG: phage tail tape measure protein [Butyrivibrio sp.]
MGEIFKLFGSVFVKTDEAQESLKNIGQQAENIGGKFDKTGSAISGIGKKFMPATAAIGGVAVSTGKMAMDFEDAIAKVSTIADTTQVPIEDLEKSILELSNTSGIASTEIAENVYNAISAGQSTGDAVNFVENSTKLAKAGFAEAGDALDILTTILNSYGMEASEVTNVSDMLIQTQNLGKTTVAELSSAMGKVIPTAKANGVQLDQLCGSYAVMTSNGIATAETTTYLNSMLNELGKQGTSAANAFAAGTEHIKEGGLTMAEAMEMGWNLTDVLSILDKQAAESGTTIGNMFGSAEAGKAATVLYDNAEKLNSAVQQMGDSAGATDEAYAKLETDSFNLQKVLNEVKNTGIELGKTIMSSLGPMIEAGSEKVHQFCEWFSKLDEGQKQTILKIGMLVAAVGPALIVVGKVVSGVGSIITVGGKLIKGGSMLISGISKLAGVAKGLFALMAANPIMLVVAAVAALVAGFVYLWNNCEGFRNFFINMWENIKEAAGNGVEFVKEKIDGIKEFFGGVKEAAGGVLNNVKEETKERLGEIKNAYDEHGGGLAGAAAAAMEAVHQKYKLGYDVLNKVTGGKLDEIKEKFSDKMSGLKDKAEEKLSEIKEKFNGKFEDAKGIVKGAIDAIKGFFNFEWHLPELKLPHFSMSGEFNLNPPSVPKLSVDWYAKAMDKPVIMNKPTAFGINADGQIMAGGEKGSEVVSGTDTLMTMIREAVLTDDSDVSGELSNISAKLDKLIEAVQMLAQLGLSIKVDDPYKIFKLVKSEQRKYDKALGGT